VTLHRVKQWKKALGEAAGFAGWDVSNYRYAYTFCSLLIIRFYVYPSVILQRESNSLSCAGASCYELH